MPGLSGMLVSGGGGGGNITPSSPYDYDPRYGGKPQVPDPGSSAASAINANLGNWGALSNLISKANDLSATSALHALQLNMPNYDALAAARSKVLGSWLGGIVPQDVVDQLIQRAAQRGIATGSPGGQNANAAYLRALGLTSLDLMGKGLTGFSQAIHDTPVGTQMRPESMMITPDAIQQARMAANLYASAPVPSAAAQNQMYDMPRGGGGWNSNIGPVRLGGGGSSSPYSNPEPQYGTYVGYGPGYGESSGGIGMSNISTASPTGSSYWGANMFQQPSAWGAPSGTTYNPIGNTYNAPMSQNYGPATPDYFSQVYGPTAPDYGPETPSYFSNPYGPTTPANLNNYSPYSPGYYNDYGPSSSGYQGGYDPILDASTSGPSWWDSISGDNGYYPFSGADLGTGGGWMGE